MNATRQHQAIEAMRLAWEINKRVAAETQSWLEEHVYLKEELRLLEEDEAYEAL